MAQEQRHFMQRRTTHTLSTRQFQGSVPVCSAQPLDPGPWPTLHPETVKSTWWGLKQHARAALANQRAQITKLQFPRGSTW